MTLPHLYEMSVGGVAKPPTPSVSLPTPITPMSTSTVFYVPNISPQNLQHVVLQKH